MPKNRSLLVRLGKCVGPMFNRIIARGSLVPNTPVLDKEPFPWAKMLEERAPVIIAEFNAILMDRDSVPALRELLPDHKRIAPDHRRKSLFLYGYGIRVPENCERVPRTAEIVAKVPGLCSALFSILEAGGEIPSQNGVTKGMLNSHFGLSVPTNTGKCWIEIGGERHQWQPGRLVIFDDTYKHSVHNQTKEIRGILFLQVERPVFGTARIAQRLFLTDVRYSAFVKDAQAGINERNRRRRNATERDGSAARRTDWSVLTLRNNRGTP